MCKTSALAPTRARLKRSAVRRSSSRYAKTKTHGNQISSSYASVTGSAPAFGGGISTASGLYFIGAAMDKYFRAFDVETGEVLWSHRMPFAGTAVPMTYRTRKDGRQFVVIAAGGNPLGDMGDAVVAYALPE